MSDQGFEEFASSVGGAIKALRIAAGLTQEDVAHASDLSLRHYQHVEAGTMNATLKSLYMISSALRVAPNAVLNRAAKAPVKKPSSTKRS